MDHKARVLAAFASDRTPDRVPWVEQLIKGKVISSLVGRELVDPTHDVEINRDRIKEYHLIAADVYRELGLDGIGCCAWTPTIADAVIVNGEIQPGVSQPGIVDWDSFNKRTKELYRPAQAPFAQYVEPWFDALSRSNMFLPLAVGMQYRMLEVSVGFENMAIWSVEQPDLLHACARFFCDWTCEAIQMILDRFPFDAIWLNDDIAFKTTTFVSPALLREFVFPYHRRIVAVATSYGLPSMFHSDGNLSLVMEDLIDIGFVSVHPLERLAFDIRDARKLVGDRITLMGNVDIDFLERGEPRACYQEAASLIAELGPARYVIASGNSITEWVKAENLRAMSRAVLEQKPRDQAANRG